MYPDDLNASLPLLDPDDTFARWIRPELIKLGIGFDEAVKADGPPLVGGFGRVWKVIQPETPVSYRRVSAIKVLTCTDPVRKSEILREANLLKALAAPDPESPGLVTKHIARLQEVAEIDEYVLLVLDQYGQDLYRWIQSAGVQGVDEALMITIQLCDALRVMHAKGAAHCDVKPHNVLRHTGEGIWVLADCGAARSLRYDDPPDTWSLGFTFDPPAALQAPGAARYVLRDLAGAGALLYWLLTGKIVEENPWTPEGWGVIRRTLDERTSLPTGLTQAIGRCFGQGGVFGDASELLRELRSVNHPKTDPVPDELVEYLRSLKDSLYQVPLTRVRTDVSFTQNLPRVYVGQLTDVEIGMKINYFAPATQAGKSAQPTSGTPAALAGDPFGFQELMQRILIRTLPRPSTGIGMLSSSGSRALSVLEAAAFAPSLVLIGVAGMGKSTFARYLALNLAGELLGDTTSNVDTLNMRFRETQSTRGGTKQGSANQTWSPWVERRHFPVFVSLLDFVDSRVTDTDIDDKTGWLYAFLCDSRRPKPLTGRGIAKLEEWWRQNGGVLILDGLDEIADYGSSGETGRLDRIAEMVEAFKNKKDFSKLRIIITSRPPAYDKLGEEHAWKRIGTQVFFSATLQAFQRQDIQWFCNHWYSDADPHAARHLFDLACEPKYMPLAERPLLLTLMGIVHREHDGRLPEGGRPGLYEEAVRLLIETWNSNRGIPAFEAPGSRQTLAEICGCEFADVRRALEEVAFNCVRERSGRLEAADVGDDDFYGALSRALLTGRKKIDTGTLKLYLNERSGIFYGLGKRKNRFAHRTFEDYLAACYLLRRERPPGWDIQSSSIEDRLTAIIENAWEWEEVLEFLVGMQLAPVCRLEQRGNCFALGNEPMLDARQLLELLVDAAPPDMFDPDLRRRAVIAGNCYREFGLHTPLSSGRDALRVNRNHVRLGLKTIVMEGDLLEPARANVADILAIMKPEGDDRPGVLTLPRSRDDEEFWTRPIHAGSFLAGALGKKGTPKSFEIQTSYRISRHPITNAQYEEFMKVGYENECYWKTEKAREFLQKNPTARSLEDLRDRGFHLPNRPRVQVSWYEAMAYCAWLSDKLKFEIRLPMELEWERAARGEDGRKFPWGVEDVVGLRNGPDSGLRRTTAVGLYPDGKSPSGALDMSGNVWEWCQTAWREELVDEPAAEVVEGEPPRALRGGSWDSHVLGLRCAGRDRDHPVIRDNDIGFRVVAPVD